MMNTNFLTPDERKLIQNFLENGIPTAPLIELKNRKNAELIQCLDSLVPCQKMTWRNFIITNKVDCPLDNFLNTFRDLLEDSDLPEKIEKGRRYPQATDPRISLLEKLEADLKVHGYPCEICCPAK